MLKLSIVLLVFATIAQLVAVILALMQMERAGKYRAAWGCVSFALLLMLGRRVPPLERAISVAIYDFSDAVITMAISVFLVMGMVGLRRLFDDMEAQRKHLETLAAIDPLTGLNNRRRLFERAHAEIERCQRSGESLTLFMLDLDHFKAVNDRYGHAAGDAMLVAVSNAISATLRRVDIAGRIGGEEFVILLPDTNREAASAAAERLRSALAAARTDDGIGVTTSLGVAIAEQVPVDANAAEYFRELIHEADTALYLAKERGRNRVEFWSAEMAIQAS
ncbi:MAG: GGDEF domain-containing protein [Betaproteobacteria bacterium]